MKMNSFTILIILIHLLAILTGCLPNDEFTSINCSSALGNLFNRSIKNSNDKRPFSILIKSVDRHAWAVMSLANGVKSTSAPNSSSKSISLPNCDKFIKNKSEVLKNDTRWLTVEEVICGHGNFADEAYKIDSKNLTNVFETLTKKTGPFLVCLPLVHNLQPETVLQTLIYFQSKIKQENVKAFTPAKNSSSGHLHLLSNALFERMKFTAKCKLDEYMPPEVANQIVVELQTECNEIAVQDKFWGAVKLNDSCCVLKINPHIQQNPPTTQFSVWDKSTWELDCSREANFYAKGNVFQHDDNLAQESFTEINNQTLQSWNAAFSYCDRKNCVFMPSPAVFEFINPSMVNVGICSLGLMELIYREKLKLKGNNRRVGCAMKEIDAYSGSSAQQVNAILFFCKIG